MTEREANILFLIFVIVLALAEYFWRRLSGRGYDFGALGGHIGIVLGGRVSQFLGALIIAPVLFAAYSVAPWTLPLDDWRVWVAGFFAVEFCYYWQHRLMHTIRWGWASHGVHHSTNEFTLPASFRLSWLSPLSLMWLVYVPMALAGFHPVLIFALQVVNIRFQYILHTEAVGKLGPLEWVFNTPSHHRVHHGSNEEYLDKNFGGVLIVFDRMFGTFAEERDANPVVYGLTKKLESNNPFVIVFHEWGNMLRDVRAARNANEVFRALLGRPSDLGFDQRPDDNAGRAGAASNTSASTKMRREQA